MLEVKAKDTCNRMRNSVAFGSEPSAAMDTRSPFSRVSTYREVSLYTPTADRKYVNLSERAALIDRLHWLPKRRRLFVLTLIWTGARVSEVLALVPASFQIDVAVVAVQTLKRRCAVTREIPIPPVLMAELGREFGLREAQRDSDTALRPLWRFHRVTAWRVIKAAMEQAGIHGVRATPRGLRHAFGVNTLGANVPLDLVQRLLGHTSLRTTAIYTQAIGPEQRALTARFWR